MATGCCISFVWIPHGAINTLATTIFAALCVLLWIIIARQPTYSVEHLTIKVINSQLYIIFIEVIIWKMYFEFFFFTDTIRCNFSLFHLYNKYIFDDSTSIHSLDKTSCLAFNR